MQQTVPPLLIKSISSVAGVLWVLARSQPLMQPCSHAATAVLFNILSTEEPFPPSVGMSSVQRKYISILSLRRNGQSLVWALPTEQGNLQWIVAASRDYGFSLVWNRVAAHLVYQVTATVADLYAVWGQVLEPASRIECLFDELCTLFFPHMGGFKSVKVLIRLMSYKHTNTYAHTRTHTRTHAPSHTELFLKKGLF